MSYYTVSTLLRNTSHTTMYHDTIIVLEHSVRYRKSIYYSLVTLSKSSYLYIDFAICLQYAYKLAIHKYYPHKLPSFVFIAFVMLVDPTLFCLDISIFFYFKQNFVVYEINFELLIGFSVFSNISSSWS
jgi:hypothetical protein